MRRFSIAIALLAILNSLPGLLAQVGVEADTQLLRTYGLEPEPDKVLAFFRARSPGDADRAAIEKLITQLDSSLYSERESASRALIARGPAALPFLKSLKKDATLEVARRAEDCIRKLEKLQNSDLIVAAARWLTARRPSEALQTLLDFAPNAGDPWIEEEVLACIATLGVRDDKMEPQLVAALKGTPSARRSAVYVLAQRGDLSQRDIVRQFFADTDATVAERATQGLLGKRYLQSLQDLAASDAAVVKSHGLGVDEASLVDFLKKNSLADDEQQRIKEWIRNLGHVTFQVRNQASRDLVRRGTPTRALLRAAIADPDPEISRRAKLCIEELERGPGPNLAGAVIRALARGALVDRKSPALALRVLLAYVPFVEDDNVEEEALAALCLLSTREAKVDPLLTAALHDPQPARRAAAAFVLGKVGTRDHHAGVRKLIEDPLPLVRLRTAQGLLASRDRDGVPALIQLLGELSGPVLTQVEEQLFRLAGDKGPTTALGDGTAAQKAATVKAWQQWWQTNASSIDLARAADGEFHLGLMTVCEYDSAVGQQGGQVWEGGRDGKPRWKITGVLGAMDAQVLPNGRVLVAENSAQRVTERDATGAIKWQYQCQGNPIACQRLPNGNTFLATYNQLMEIGPDQRIIYNHNRGPAFYIFSARKTRSGHIVCMSAQGVIMEIEAATGKEIRQINLGPNGGWCSAELLPNGRYLVATMNTNQVREIDAAGKTHWSVSMQGAFRATRLPNGNTLVASMTSRKIAEFDRAGTMRWEKQCDGRPWSVRYR